MPNSKPCNRKLLGLVAAQEKRVNRLYNSAARDISIVLRKYKLKSKTDVWLGNANAKKEVDAIMAGFQSNMVGMIKGGMGESWGMADNCNDSLVNSYLKKQKTPKGIKDAILYRNPAALNSFVNRRRNGLNLSDRVWNITKETKKQFEQLLASGVMDGRSAQGMATDLKRYLKEPSKQFRRVRNSAGKLVLSNPAKDYHPGRGVYRSSYQNSLRLARNEVNMSYRHNDHLRRQQMPFVTGITVHLSNSHPEYDICDDLQGDYPKTFRFGGWHPNCICYTTSKLLPKEEFKKYLNTGKIKASRNVKGIPKRAKTYLKDNADRFSNYKNPPYFLKDNFDLKDGTYNFTNRNEIINTAKAADLDSQDFFQKNGVYTPERKALHDDIINKLMNEVPHHQGKKQYMLGGATANGKSTLVNSGKLPHPKGILTVDSDKIKSLIPEYNTMLANGDKLAASFVHEESSMLAKRLIETAQRNGNNFVLDGVNDGSIEKVMKKIAGYKKGGKTIRADYCSLDSNLSLDLARARAEKTGRFVPEKFTKATNVEVSNLVPELIKRNAIDELYLWDTNVQGKARLILTQINGKLKIHSKELYDRFLLKAAAANAEKAKAAKLAKAALKRAAAKAERLAVKEAAEKAEKLAAKKLAKAAAAKEKREAAKLAKKLAAKKEVKVIQLKPDKPIPASRIPQEVKFVPAETIAEAEQYALKNGFAKKVNYSGASLEQVNAINEGILTVRNTAYSELLELESIVMDFKLNSTARVESGFMRFNPNQFGKWNAKNRADKIASLEKRILSQKEQLKSYGISQEDKKYIRSKIKKIEDELKYQKSSKAFVSTEPVDIVVHEMGHVIENHLYSINRFTDKLIQFSGDRAKVGIEWKNSLLSKLDKIAYDSGRKLSHYATSNSMEYFAEAWVHYTKGFGMEAIHPELLEIFQKITKEKVRKALIAENIQVNKLMKLAKASAPEVDLFAKEMAEQFGGYVTPVNLKGRASLIRKLRDKYGGDVGRLADAVRTTIIVEEKYIDKILAIYDKNPNFTKVARQFGDDYLGYSGSITNYRNSKGILAEIQVNTERMIFGKEKPADAKRIIGIKRWNQIKRTTGLEGGLGHVYYEEHRVIKAATKKAGFATKAQEKRLAELLKLSKNYYKNFF